MELIGQGTYGCVIKPGLSCDYKHLSPKFITKIHSKNSNVEREIEISEKIRTYPKFSENFAPILERCNNMNLANVKITKKEDVDECKFLTTSQSYVGTKIRFIEGLTINKYINEKIELDTTQKRYNNLLKIVLDIYQKIFSSIDILLSLQIVHNDLKEDNIIIKQKTHVPIIIDFGSSLDMKRIIENKVDLKSQFIFSTKYILWNIDQVLISYIVHNKSLKDEISSTEMISLYDELMYNNSYEQMDLIKPMLPKYRELFIKKFANKSRNCGELMKTLMNKYQFWDKYSVSRMIMKIMHEIDKRNVNYGSKSSKGSAEANKSKTYDKITELIEYHLFKYLYEE